MTWSSNIMHKNIAVRYDVKDLILLTVMPFLIIVK